jgi:hypothetical protein
LYVVGTALGFATMTALDAANLVLSAVGLAGVFGYAHARRVIGNGLWRVWAVSQPLWDAFYSLIAGSLGWTDLNAGAATNEIEYWVTAALVGLIELPTYIALFRYGYRSQALWERTES